MKKLLAVLAMVFTVAIAGNASAYTTDLPTLTSITSPGTVPTPYYLGSYLTGSYSSGTAPASAYGWTEYGVTPADGNSLDHHWMHAGTSLAIWDLGTPSSTAYVFPVVEHIPAPYEAFEFTAYGSNDLSTWGAGTLTAAYADGWVDSGTAIETDDWASVWSFSSPYRYIGILAGGSMTIYADAAHTTWSSDADNYTGAGWDGWQSYEAEIDAVGAPTSVPEPSTLLLLGTGMAGLALARRFRKQ